MSYETLNQVQGDEKAIATQPLQERGILSVPSPLAGEG